MSFGFYVPGMVTRNWPALPTNQLPCRHSNTAIQVNADKLCPSHARHPTVRSPSTCPSQLLRATRTTAFRCQYDWWLPHPRFSCVDAIGLDVLSGVHAANSNHTETFLRAFQTPCTAPTLLQLRCSRFTCSLRAARRLRDADPPSPPSL